MSCDCASDLSPSPQILERVNLAAQDEANLALFTCFGSDTLHKGSLTLRTGAIVGIPENYGYNTVDDVRFAFVNQMITRDPGVPNQC